MYISRHTLQRSILASAMVAIGFLSKAQTPRPVPVYNNNPLNFVRTFEAKKPVSGATTLMQLTDVDDVNQQTSYLDGIGRPLQNVEWQGSPLKKDVVNSIVYDAYGREAFKYLPFVSTSAPEGGGTTDDGLFKLNALYQQRAFYNTYLTGQSQTFFYSHDSLENSPWSRVISSYAPGNSWSGSEYKPAEADRHGIDIRYSMNSVGDNVKYWQVTDGPIGTFGTYSVVATSYPAGVLTKLITEDEHGGQTIEFKDKDGNIVLRKVLITANRDMGPTSHGHDGWLNTYYMYDKIGRLRCVLTPKGERLYWEQAGLNANILNEQCFRYEYDSRDRMIMKQVPGAGTTEMVYDKRNRLIMMKDAKLTGLNYWLVNRYDDLNRLVQIGLLANSGSRQSHQTAADLATGTYPASIGDLMQENYYDNYDWVTSPTPQSGISKTVNAADSLAAFFIMTHNTAPDYAQPIRADYVNVRGKVTGSKVRVLGTGTFLHAVTFYDEDGRVLQQRSANISGGFDIFTTQYDFNGKPLRVVHRQQKSGTNSRFIRELTKYAYDHMGRVTTVTKKIGTTGLDQIIAANEYDELGRLKKKTAGTGLEVQNYDYNIRGWLLGVNRDYIKGIASTNYFAYELAYDNAQTAISGQQYTKPSFRGDIGGMIWKSVGDFEMRKYDFTYDHSRRLAAADFNQYTSGSFNKTAGMDFSVSNLTYDASGNILTMRQSGWKTSGSTFIDQLRYDYKSNSNKLGGVYDTVNDPNSKLGDFKNGVNTVDDYDYDENGNLIKDENKGISTILYNHLNLPYEVRIPGKGKIVYTYDNVGTKWKKVVYDSTGTTPVTTTWTYIHNFVYKNDTLQSFGHEEGRVRCDVNQPTGEPLNYNWDYFVKDHLGNVRMVLTQQKDTALYPSATMEDATRPAEIPYYDIQTAQVKDKSQISGASGFSSFENKLYTVHGGLAGQKTGLGIVLKVMAADKVAIRAESFYNLPGGNAGPSSSVPLTELLAAFAGSGAVSPHGIAASDVTNIAGNTSSLNSFLGTTTATNTANAHLNWVLFDDQFRYVTGGVDAVQTGGGYKNHTQFITNPVSVSKNGYLYIFVSNKSNLEVFFDNLAVTHYKGPILEETHYYPFGLTMAGISTKAFGKMETKEKYNGNELERKEFSDGSGLDWTDFGWRMYDQQIGRWQCQDPLAALVPDITPYRYGYNSPILYRDLFGLIESGMQGYTGYVYDPEKGEISFDPDVHSQDDLGPNSGLEYLGERIIVTQNGVTTWYDENGNANTSDPGWSNLPEVTVSGRRKSANFFSVSNILNYAGGTQSIYENLIFAKNKFDYKPSKGPNAGNWTTIWKTNKAGELVRDVNSSRAGYLVLKESKNAVAKFTKGINVKGAGKLLGGFGIVATVVDGATGEKGWQNHHTADVVIGVAMTLGPVGWIGGLTYLAADLITQGVTGKSITENLFD